MQCIRVGAAALNQTPLDWNGNFENIAAAIAKAKEQQVGLLCLPELCVTGYGCEDAFFSPGVLKRASGMLDKIAPLTEGIAVSVGLPIFYHNKIFNCACLLADGAIIGFVAKRFLCGDGVHYEPRWFTAWPEATQGTYEYNGERYPLGDVYFSLEGVKVGFEICEDAWVADRPGSDLSYHGVDIILNPSASHFAFGKHSIRKRFSLEGSRAFGVAYVYANLLGCEAGRLLFDGDCLIASLGEMVAEGKRFSYQDVELTTALIDLETSRM